MSDNLTLRQRHVIDRLRSAGYVSIADCATGCWESGSPCLFAVTLRDARPPGITPELAAAFDRANEEASRRDGGDSELTPGAPPR